MPHAPATLALAALLALAPLAAEAGCIEADFTDGTPRAATVTGGPRTYFVRDAVLAPGCPNASAACRAAAYLVPGDVALVAGQQDGFTCAAFTNARGVTTAGWLPTSALAPTAAAVPRLEDWLGRWSAVERSIAVTRAGADKLALKGDATWGAGDPERVRRGSVHIGEFSATAQPTGVTLSFTAEDETLPYAGGDPSSCRLRMQRRGPYLVVHDTGNCGGANVSFSGIYRRQS